MYSGSHIIKLSLAYLSNTITISISKSKLLSEVKDKAYKLFFPIKGRVILTYMGKELTAHEGKQISSIFKDLKKATIVIKVSTINSAIENEMLEADEDYKANTVTKEKKKRLPLLNNHPMAKKKITFNPLKYKTLSQNYKLLCFDCCEEPASLFCRECNLFLCSTCYKNKKSIHVSHNTLKVNINDLKKSSNDYKEALISDLEKVKSNFIKIEELKKGGNRNVEWRTRIYRKIDRFANVLGDLNNYVPKVDMRNISDNIVHTRQFEKEHEKATLILEEIKCTAGTDPFELFTIINNAEKTVSKLFEDVRVLNQYNNIQKKVVNYFLEIETEIDDLCVQAKKYQLLN